MPATSANASAPRISMLDALFPALGPSGFLSGRYLAGKPAVGHGRVARFGDLGALALFDRPAELIAASVGIQPTAYLRVADGSVKQVRLAPRDAAALHAHGTTISVERVDQIVPLVGRWVRALHEELGYAPEPMHCACLLSGPAHGVPMHFDGIDVLVVQLRGRKRWRVAENASVRDPIHSYFPTEDGAGVRAPEDGLKSAYFPARFPARMPANARSFVMRPGSVAFVPRGWWHATDAIDASVSLTFKIGGYSPLALVLSALRRRLSRAPAWRSPVRGAWRAGGRADALGQIAPILAGLDAALDGLAAEDLLAAGAGPSPRRGARGRS